MPNTHHQPAHRAFSERIRVHRRDTINNALGTLLLGVIALGALQLPNFGYNRIGSIAAAALLAALAVWCLVDFVRHARRLLAVHTQAKKSKPQATIASAK
jgi:hypothetical protein